MQFWNRLLELVYPPSCLSCSSRLLEPTPLELCGACERQIHSVPPPRCPRCGRHSTISLRDGDACLMCQQAPPLFRAGFAAFEYAATLRDCIHRMKFDSHRRLGTALGARLAHVAHIHLATGHYDLVIPVPLHPSRRRDRGFNQAELLAQSVSRTLGLPLEHRALQRSRRTAAQSRLPADDRQDNVSGAFRVRCAQRIAGRRLLLVDDVLTTGATANACSQALLAAGASSVDVLVLATN